MRRSCSSYASFMFNWQYSPSRESTSFDKALILNLEDGPVSEKLIHLSGQTRDWNDTKAVAPSDAKTKKSRRWRPGGASYDFEHARTECSDLRSCIYFKCLYLNSLVWKLMTVIVEAYWERQEWHLRSTLDIPTTPRRRPLSAAHLFLLVEEDQLRAGTGDGLERDVVTGRENVKEVPRKSQQTQRLSDSRGRERNRKATKGYKRGRSS